MPVMKRPFRFLLAILFAGAGFAVSAQDRAMEAPPAPKFEIRRFIVEGNTLLPAAEVERLVMPYTGKDKDFGSVQQALDALQEAYQALGYTAVRVMIPEQAIRSGEVKLQVTEARIGKVLVEGNKFFDESNVRASLPDLQPGTLPNTTAIALQVQLANDSPAKQTSVSLESSDEPGKVNAVVRLRDEEPKRLSFSLDSSGNSQTGYFRTGVGYQHANLFNADHVFNAQYITSPTQISDVTILGFGYKIPIYKWDGALEFVAGYSSVNSGTLANLFSISGSGSIYGVKYSQLLPRYENYEHRLVAGWDYRDTRNDVRLLGPGVPLLPDITVKPLSLTYIGRFNQVGQDLSFNVSHVQNIPGGETGSQDAFAAQRLDARAAFSYTRFAAGYTLAFGDDLLFRANVAGQYTRDRLIGGEQFGMGGADSVRGFFEREATNDIGHRVSFEGYTPDFGARLGGNWRARGLVFFDMARGRDVAPVRNADNGMSSYGLGLRINEGKRISLRVDWAVVDNQTASRSSGKQKVHFGLVYSY